MNVEIKMEIIESELFQKCSKKRWTRIIW